MCRESSFQHCSGPVLPIYRSIREREVLVRVMYCLSVRLEDKGGVQSDLPLNGCLGGSGLFSKKCLILRDLGNLSKSDNRLFVLGILWVGMKPRPLERTRSEVGSRG